MSAEDLEKFMEENPEYVARLAAKAFRSRELLGVGNRSYVDAFKYPQSRFDARELLSLARAEGPPDMAQTLNDPGKLLTDRYLIPPSIMIFQWAGLNYQKKWWGEVDGGLADAAAVIQAALNALTSGGEIFVRRSLYSISKSISFAGLNNIDLMAERGTILSAAAGFTDISMLDNVLDRIKIENFILQCNNLAGGIRGHPTTPMTDVRIFRNRILASGAEGISSTYNLNQDVYIVENLIDMQNGGGDCLQIAGRNVHALRNKLINWMSGANAIAANGLIDGMWVENNLIDGGGTGGVAVSFDSAMANGVRTMLRCRGNRITNIASDGIRGYTSAGLAGCTAEDWIIAYNRIVGGRWGMYFNFVNESAHGKDIQIPHNKIVGSTGGIYLAIADNSAALGNRACACAGVGLAFDGVSRSIIKGNFGLNNGQNAGYADRCGILLNNVIISLITDNECFDDQGVKTQQDGFKVTGSCNSNIVLGNILLDNAANPINNVAQFGMSALKANRGYNPRGSLANPYSVAAGPLDDFAKAQAFPSSGVDYTVWDSPKLIIIGGGTITSVSIDGVATGQAGAGTPATAYRLEPGQVWNVVWTVQPTINGVWRC